MLLFNCWLLLFVCALNEELLVVGRPVEMGKATYEIKQGKLLNFEVGVGLINVQLGEQELYRPQLAPCFGCSEAVRNQSRHICNYASRQCCGCDIIDGVQQSSVSSFCRAEAQKNGVCRPQLQWTEVSVGDLNVTISQGQYLTFRYTHLVPCHGFRIMLYYYYGQVDMWVSSEEAEPREVKYTTWHTVSLVVGQTKAFVCPADERFKYGTYYVTIFGRSDSAFILNILTTEAFEITPGAACANATSVHKCVPDAETQVLRMETEEWKYFNYELLGTPDSCSTVLINVRQGTGDIAIYASTRLQIPNYYYGVWPEWSSYKTFDNTVIAGICFNATQTKIDIYIALETWVGGTAFLTVTSKVDIRPFLRPISEYTALQYAYDCGDSLYMTCPNSGSQLLTCFEFAFDCLFFWQLFPSSDPLIFWPQPALWGSLGTRASTSVFSELVRMPLPQSFKKGSLWAVLLLNHDFLGFRRTPFPETVLTHHQCKVYASGTLFNKEGEPFIGSQVPTANNDLKCTHENLEQVSYQANEIIKQLSNVSTIAHQLELNYAMDNLLLTSAWTKCDEAARSLLIAKAVNSTKIVDRCYDALGSEEFLKNPCCNKQLLNTQCCVPTKQTFQEVIYLGRNESSLDNVNAKSCINSYLLDFLQVLNSNFSCSFLSSDLLNQRQSDLKFYFDCKKAFRVDEMVLGGRRCLSDEDCNADFEINLRNKCNRISERCILDPQFEAKFMKCVVDNLDGYLKRFLKDSLQLTSVDDVEEYLEAFRSPDCVNSDGAVELLTSSISSSEELLRNDANNYFAHSFWFRSSINSECGLSYTCPTISCVDILCTSPINQCDQLCLNQWVLKGKNQQQCQSFKKCNYKPERCNHSEPVEDCWRTCISETDTSQHFCGFCENDAHCVEIPGVDEKQCKELGSICLFPNGTTSLLPEQQCTSIGVCTSSCNGTMCDNERMCLESSGICEDQLYLKSDPETGNGACIEEYSISPFQNKRCLTGVLTPEGCQLKGLNKTECEAVNKAVWRSLSETKQQCLSRKACVTDYLSRATMAFLPEEECLKDCSRVANFSYEPVYAWSSGSWASGISKRLGWRKREVVDLYQWKRTLNFTKMYETISLGVQLKVLDIIRSESICRFTAENDIFSAIACDLHSSSEGISCFNNDIRVLSGKTTPCVGNAVTVETFIALIHFPRNAISFDSQERCSQVEVFTISAQNFKHQDTKNGLSSFARGREFDEYNIVLNDNDAIVGRIIGDGIEVHMTNPVNKVLVCLSFRDDLGSGSDDFDTYGFAKSDSSFEFLYLISDVKILGAAEVEQYLSKETDYRLCGLFTDGKSKMTLFPVKYEDDYQDESGSMYSSSERGAFWFMAALYTVSTSLSFAFLVLQIFSPHKLNYLLLLSILFICSFNIVRMIYFYLTAAAVLHSTANENEDVANYFLIEFPTFLYFSAYICLIIFWYNYLHL